jgi:hypothetical protein
MGSGAGEIGMKEEPDGGAVGAVVQDVADGAELVGTVMDGETFGTLGPEAAGGDGGLELEVVGGFAFGNADEMSRIVGGETGEDVEVDAVDGDGDHFDAAAKKRGGELLDGKVTLSGSEIDGGTR